MNSKSIICLISSFLLILPIPAYCDMVWPALYFEGTLLTWWVIIAGLIVELPFYFFIVNKDYTKTLLAAVACNAISTVLGIILIPLLGILWEIFPGIIMYKFLNIGTFNPITYCATFILAVLASTAIEYISVIKIFKNSILMNKKTIFILMLIANVLSTSIALIPVFNKYGNVFMR